MKLSQIQSTRRKFITYFASALGLAPIAYTALRSGQAIAQDKPLDPKDPRATQLQYVEDAAKAPAALKATKPGKCSDCAFFKATDAKRGSCSMFPGKTVNINGWCSVWTKKP